MKGIREMAMGTPEPEIPEYKPSSYPPYKPKKYFGSNRGGWQPDYPEDTLFGTRKSKLNDNLPEVFDPNTGESSYSEKYEEEYHAPGQIKIEIYISRVEIGEVADELSPKADWQAADALALEMGYDKIEELLGKGYESKYQASFASEEGIEDYTITATLIPV